jgi:hypothetical protein
MYLFALIFVDHESLFLFVFVVSEMIRSTACLICFYLLRKQVRLLTVTASVYVLTQVTVRYLVSSMMQTLQLAKHFRFLVESHKSLDLRLLVMTAPSVKNAEMIE